MATVCYQQHSSKYLLLCSSREKLIQVWNNLRVRQTFHFLGELFLKLTFLKMMSCAAVFSICLTFPGEESLKKSFDFFEEMDVHCHNRFFRFIGLSDNSIKSAESIFPEDRVYELLKIWMEKEGLKADFNSLIEALINLDQKLSAENIIAKAIINGYFKYEDE